MKKKLYWITPLTHHVYKGRMFLFDTFFNLRIYDNNKLMYGIGKQKPLIYKKSLSTGLGNFYNIYSNKDIEEICEDDVVITGDIFTNNLSFPFRWKNTIYYSEFFMSKTIQWYKKILFLIFTLPRRGRKILVPTQKSHATFKKISKKVFYLPQIYYGDICRQNVPDTKQLKILFVGRVDDWKKNIKLLIESVILLSEREIDIQLSLVGLMIDKEFLQKYKHYITSGLLNYIEFVPHDELKNIYLSHHVFVLPSINDPIGAVVMEAMAHGLPIIASDAVGASDYIHDGENGFIFESNNMDDLTQKIEYFSHHKEELKKMGDKSYSIVEESYWYKNKTLLKSIYTDLFDFIYS